MGARPLSALAIVGFNSCEMDIELFRDMMRGALDKLKEAGAVLLGGHTVDDKEPKFGLSVTGVCEDGRFISQRGAREGDLIVMTKPIGTGVLIKALKEGLLKQDDLEPAIKNMLELNDRAGIVMKEAGASAGTDVTGFGLLGHLLNICRNSRVGAKLYWNRIPIYETTIEFVRKGIYPKGAKENLSFVSGYLETNLEGWKVLLASDPVTSGGLLFTVSPSKKERVEDLARKHGTNVYTIGEITKGDRIILLED